MPQAHHQTDTMPAYSTDMKRKKLYFAVLLSLGLALTGCGSEKSSGSAPTKAAEVVEINTGNSNEKAGKQENAGNNDEKAGNAADSEKGGVSTENKDNKPEEDSTDKTETVTNTPEKDADKEDQPDIIGIGEKPGEKNGENAQGTNGDNTSEGGSAGSGNNGQGSNGTEPGNQGSGGNDQNDTGSGNNGRGDGGNAGQGESQNSSGSIQASDFTVSLNGNKLSCGDDFLPFADKMGTAARIEEGQACLEGGYDTNYYYGDSLAVYTIAKGGKQLIYDIYITGSAYPTAKGVKVGTTTKEEVGKLYGEPSSTLPAADRYVSGTKTLSVEYKGGVVSGIDISDSSVE